VVYLGKKGKKRTGQQQGVGGWGEKDGSQEITKNGEP